MQGASHRLRLASDLAGAVVLVLLATFAVVALPEGSALRIALVLPIFLFAPGYLLMQTVVVPRATGRTRLLHWLFAIGLSPAVVTLLALLTAVVPGGFRPAPIVSVVTVGCLGMAQVAYVRRIRLSDSAPPLQTRTPPTLAAPPVAGEPRSELGPAVTSAPVPPPPAVETFDPESDRGPEGPLAASFAMMPYR